MAINCIEPLHQSDHERASIERTARRSAQKDRLLSGMERALENPNLPLAYRARYARRLMSRVAPV